MSKPRTAFQATLTVAEKDAAVRAVIVDGMTYSEVARRAARGELEGAGKFTISDTYVGRLAKRQKAEHSPKKLAQPGEDEKAIREARAGVLAWILIEKDRWETDAKAGKIDLPKAGRIMRALNEYERTADKRSNGHAEPEQDDPNTNTQHTAQALIAELQQMTKANGNGEGEAASLSSQLANPDPSSGDSTG